PVRAAWTARRETARALAEAEAALAAARQEEEYLRHAVAELDKLSPEPGEEQRLDIARRAMQGAERIRDDVARALQMLGGNGAETAMVDAARWLEGAAARAEGRLDAPLAALSRALIELGEATQGIEDALSALDFDPSALESTEERLFALRALARKHDILPDDLAGLAGQLRDRLERIDAGEAQMAALRSAAREAEAAYDAAAAALT
ncbi:DNA repair protein RecN, partial [Paracoccus liaowanqingii]